MITKYFFAGFTLFSIVQNAYLNLINLFFNCGGLGGFTFRICWCLPMIEHFPSEFPTISSEYLKPIIKNYSKKEIKIQKLNYSKISKELRWNQKTKRSS